MDAWLTRMYARYGSRYLWGSIVAVILVGLVVLLPLLALFPSVYLGIGFSGWAKTLIVSYAIGLFALAVAAFALPFEDTRAWTDGDRTPERAARAGQWAFSQPRRAILIACAVGFVVGVPAVAWAILSSLDTVEGIDILEIGIGTTGAAIAGALISYFICELLLRPIRRSLADFAVPVPRTHSLATTLGLLVVSLVYIATIGAGYLFVDRGSSGGELLIVYAAALVPTALLAGGVLVLLSVSVVGPVGDLIRGTRAVKAGDLACRVPVTTTDELGELATGFNEMVEELAASRSRIVAASDGARRKVERDLHDGAQQNLVLLDLKLGLAERAIADDRDDAAELVAEAREELGRGLAELRDLARGIYPQVLASAGVVAALEDAAANAAIPTDLEAEEIGRFDPDAEAAVYFCCLEALQNAAKHAGDGARASVAIRNGGGGVAFEVTDDGVGFDPASVNGTSSGLQNMRDRLGALGGEVRIESAPGSGTRVCGSVPVKG